MIDLKLPELSEIEAAAARLAPLSVSGTPLLKLCERGALRFFAKLECLQPGARCYKVRGAFNVLAKMQEEQPDVLSALRRRGIITASTGNFAVALGQVAQTLALPLTVLVPSGASMAKLELAKRLAPKARIVEVSAEVWWQSMLEERIVSDTPVDSSLAGALFISPARNLAVMEGNGTIGLELLEQLPTSQRRDLHVFVPYGGGGLCIGIASALKQRLSGEGKACRVHACEVSTGAPFGASLAAGRPVSVEHERTFVDGIGAKGVLPDNFERARQVLDGALTVTPAQIMASCRELLTTYGVVVEGAGAASLAAAVEYYSKTEPQRPTDVVCILSGGNIELSLLLPDPRLS